MATAFKPAPYAFDVAEFRTLPTMERIRILAEAWVDDGFRVPLAILALYAVKVTVFYVGLGLTIIGLVSGFGPLWTFAQWWTEPIVWQKAVIWLLFLEVIGFGGGWGPLWAQFRFLPEAFVNWTKTGTHRTPPWPWLPFTRGNSRGWFEVTGYLALLASLLVLMFSRGDGPHGVLPVSLLAVPAVLLLVLGLRDKMIFLAARGEQYWPALLIFILFHDNLVDMVIAGKILIVVVWVGAGASKIGIHFSHVIAPMLSNAPWMLSKKLKRINYRDYPNDLRPARIAVLIAHILGTTVEISCPLLLLFTTNKYVAIFGVLGMLGLHAFIVSALPMAVPLEWNVLFSFLAVWLFWAHGSWQGYSLYDMSNPWITVAVAGALLLFPILGNFRPDKVSFLPSMRQYAGNWSTGMFAFAPNAELALDSRFRKSAPTTLLQLMKHASEDDARTVLDTGIAFRAMHSQGRGLLSVLQVHLDHDFDTYDLREPEMTANSLLGWTFGDAHLFNEQLMANIQRQCQFAPGDCVLVLVESQPIHKFRQDYRVLDAALGCVERGWFDPRDAVREQPWLPNGPIPLHTEWRAPGASLAQEASGRHRVPSRKRL